MRKTGFLLKMDTVVGKLKTYLKQYHPTLSDAFFLFGFIFSIPFYAFAWKFMVTSDPSKIFFDTRMIISCFAITVICWAIYFVLEVRNGRIKNHLFTWVFVVYAILSIVTVLIQPTVATFLVEAKSVGPTTWKHFPDVQVGDIVNVTTTLSPTHRLFFTCASFVIVAAFYFVLVVLPQRIEKMDFLVVLAVIVVVFMFLMTCYSFITEAHKYGPFVKALIQGDKEKMNELPMTSFVVSSVPYGACMMLAFVFSLLAHTIHKKWYWYIPVVYFLINMMFSYCRTSIAISAALLLLYLTYRLILTIKKHKVRNIVFLSVLYTVVLAFIGLNLASYFTKGAFAPIFNKHIEAFFDQTTIKTRTYVWGNIRNELKGGWLVIGRGFGTHNFMLYPMNLVNGDDVCPSHSTYYAILGAGGIVTLVGFFGLLAYYVFAFIKCFKVNKAMAIGLSFPFLGFMMYSFTEGVNYLIVAFTFPLILYYNIIKKQA